MAHFKASPKGKGTVDPEAGTVAAGGGAASDILLRAPNKEKQSRRDLCTENIPENTAPGVRGTPMLCVQERACAHTQWPRFPPKPGGEARA